MSKTKTYTKKQVTDASLEYFNGDEIAAGVFAKKYSLRNEKLELLELTPDDTHRRLSKEFARIEKKFPNSLSEEEIFASLRNFDEILPGGSPIFGIGNTHQIVSVSNCFVIDVVDSYGGICQADERIVQISKRRGGVGLDISPIRPKGMPTKNSSFTTDGIGLFMKRFSNSSREVAQHGRRGALMISISVHHPEIMNFIKIKRNLEEVNGANISIRVTDEFMKAVKADKEYEQRWPVDATSPVVSQKVKAREIWDEMVKSIYLAAEPGILFWDNIIKNSPADSYSKFGFTTESTNPCGELPLCPLDSCRLMALNLIAFVTDPFTENAKFDDTKFKAVVSKAQRLSDDLVELETEAVNKIIKKIRKDPEANGVKKNELDMWLGIREKCSKGRRTGLGITGLADCLAMLGIKYGTQEAVKMVDYIYESLRNNAYRASVELAKERGAFPLFDHDVEKDNAYLNRLPDDIKKDMKKHGRRNIGCLTTPPAGSISIEAQCSNGFEPVFKAEYFRKVKLSDTEAAELDPKEIIVDKLNGDKYQQFTIVHHGLTKFKELTGKTYEESPYFGAEAADLDFNIRVKMQAAATQYVDHAISSTINLPNKIKDMNVDQYMGVISNLYMEAWEQGCKGLTIFRDGSRPGILSGEETNCEDCDESKKQLIEILQNGGRPEQIIPSIAPKRERILKCDIHRSSVGGGDWLFFIGLLEDGQPYEIFGGESSSFTIPYKYKEGWIIKNGLVNGVTQYNLVLGSLEDENEKMEIKQIANTFNNYEFGAFTRLASLTMRHGAPIKYICEQITKKGVEGDLRSFQRAMSRVLKKYITEGDKAGIECTECGSSDVVYRNGCPACQLCGHSACS